MVRGVSLGMVLDVVVHLVVEEPESYGDDDRVDQGSIFSILKSLPITTVGSQLILGIGMATFGKNLELYRAERAKVRDHVNRHMLL